MALTINTNMASLLVQQNLDKATTALNKSIQRMTTGYKINSAPDDAAGYTAASNMQTQLGSISVCQDNVAIGTSLLSTASSNYDLIQTHLQRIRDLTEEASNGTYGTDSLNAITTEISARYAEIDRISASTDYNGINLLNGSQSSGINIKAGTDSSANSSITLGSSVFQAANTSALTGVSKATFLSYYASGTSNYTAALSAVDKALDKVTSRQTNIGAIPKYS